MSERRNNAGGSKTILFVMVDQLSAKWLEVAETGVVDLPNLRKLRESSSVYTRAYSVNPVCSPTRATLLTGYRPEVHGLTECGYELDPRVHTLPRQLQNEGWETAISGKMHVKVQLESAYPDYSVYGFTHTAITEDSRVGQWLDWVREVHPQHYQAALATVWMSFIPELEEYGEDKRNLRREIEAAAAKYPECQTECYVLPFPKEVSQTAWITDNAIQFLQSSPQSSDLFLQVSYVQPHNPFCPPGEYLERVDEDRIPEPVKAEWVEQHLPYFDQELYRSPSYEKVDWKRDRLYYFADLAHLDDEIGRLLDALSGVGRSEDALVVFTSDHGEMLHDHGMLGKWERHYDACVRIPLYVRGPNSDGGTCRQLVSHLDVVPTMYEYAGVEPPRHSIWKRDGFEATLPTLPGRSLLSEVEPACAQERKVLVASYNNHWLPGPRSWSRTLLTNRYRFTRYLGGGGEQLFDLAHDPDEQVNLALQADHAETVRQLREELLEACAVSSYPGSNVDLYQVGSW